ncbi:MAG TPA: hypothetical protein VG649_11075, partial [Candidatus Angelobacter sp.]|nr:hypothetical protein [Candidatus Angelobacter sp.]
RDWILGIPTSPSSYYVDGDALGLGQFADIFGRDHAGAVWAIGEDDDYLSAEDLGCVPDITEKRFARTLMLTRRTGMWYYIL